MLKSLVNAFYYLHSEAYEKINVNHRLSLFLNLCDGYIINTREKSNFMNWYFIYVIELALRIGFFKQIGFTPSDEEIEYAMNEINDQFIYECDLEEECKNPINKMKQDIRRSGITIR